MRKQNKKVRIIQLSLDELREKANRVGDSVPYEFKNGLYYEMDFTRIGEMANLYKIIQSGFLPPHERQAVEKMLGGFKLDSAERKAYERAVKKLKALCNR